MTSPFAKWAADLCFGKGAAARLDRGACPMCKRENALQTLEDEDALTEYNISGLCQDCQDRVFEGGEDD